jgi:hypothetical protein
MDYTLKYIKYKNKYNSIKKELLKQIGSGIEEYDDQTKPVLLTIFTNIDNIGIYYFSGNPIKSSILKGILTTLLGETMLIEVRGNGLCMLNAICTVKFIMIENHTTRALLDLLAGFHNKSKEINYSNILNENITKYIKIIHKNVNENLLLLSDEIIKLNSKKFGFIFNYEMLDFKRDMNQENYSFDQLGQVLSTILDSVIILLNINMSNSKYTIHGKFPAGERHSLDEMKKDYIDQQIMSGKWSVIFILNIDNRHYNSLIPIGSSEEIKRNNIEKYLSIKKDIEWN